MPAECFYYEIINTVNTTGDFWVAKDMNVIFCFVYGEIHVAYTNEGWIIVWSSW